ncbi:MAG UNVERIFIED_CONTAM: hypothetical protein LVR18_03760 [Planctomycetaceae bacterium]
MHELSPTEAENRAKEILVELNQAIEEQGLLRFEKEIVNLVGTTTQRVLEIYNQNPNTDWDISQDYEFSDAIDKMIAEDRTLLVQKKG